MNLKKKKISWTFFILNYTFREWGEKSVKMIHLIWRVFWPEVFNFSGIYSELIYLKCCKIVFALFCLMPSGIMSRMSCITDALSSRSKWDSTLCLVTVLATPLECLPSNCLESKFPSHLSSNGVTPLMKNNQTLHPGAHIPQPGPLPTGPWNFQKH